jgi:hypothetical protein
MTQLHVSDSSSSLALGRACAHSLIQGIGSASSEAQTWAQTPAEVPIPFAIEDIRSNVTFRSCSHLPALVSASTSALHIHRRMKLCKPGCENIVQLRKLAVLLVMFTHRHRSPIRIRVKQLVNTI